MTTPPVTLYVEVVNITYIYLGPAAERFIARQVQNHLHKDPDELAPEDLNTLIDWVKVAISVVTEDTTVVEEYINRLKELTDKRGRKHAS